MECCKHFRGLGPPGHKNFYSTFPGLMIWNETRTPRKRVLEYS